jgi:catechol 2,3-dioxygenase-like lactoylglutathione lyase family enzyme
MSQDVTLSFSHVGLFVTDLEKMVDFYTRHIGLVVSDREKRPDGSEIAFMIGDPREHNAPFSRTRPRHASSRRSRPSPCEKSRRR